MKSLRLVFQVGLLTWLGIALAVESTTAQTGSQNQAQPTASEPRKLTGDDARREAALDKTIDAAVKTDRWDEAIAKAEELLALRTRVQGPKHFETISAEWRLKTLRRVAAMPRDDRIAYLSATTMKDQGQRLYDQGKYAAAQPVFEKALEIRRRLLTDDHPETASSYDDVGESLKGQGKYAAAQPLYEKALQIQRRALTDDHPDTAISYTYLGLSLNAQGKHAQAQLLLEKALEIFRRLLSDNHPFTAVSYGNLAGSLAAQAKHAQAQPLLEKALEIRRRLLTDDHPHTANSYNNLALNLHAQGEYAQAQPLLEKALEIHRRALTDNHPYTANTYNSLAVNMDSQGKYAQAQAFYETALKIYRELLTENHPNTARSYNNLALNLRAQEKFAEAQPLFEKALEIHRRLLSDNHPNTAKIYNNLALNLNEQGKYAEAQPLYEKALGIERQLLTDEHPDTARSYNNLAMNLAAQGKYAQGEPLIRKALEIRNQRLSDDHPLTALSYHSLASNLNAQGRYQEARDLWLSAARSLDKARLRAAFTGLERSSASSSVRPALAAVLARLDDPVAAWQALEEDLGRGLLDELAARQNSRLTPTERARLRELTTELESLDKLAETTPKNLDQEERARRFEDLKRQRELASVALGEFQSKLLRSQGPLAGEVASLREIQAALPPDTALIAWVDIPPAGPNARDPDGEHWGVVVRSRGTPAWVSLAGTGRDRLWTADDNSLAMRVRKELRCRPNAVSEDLPGMVPKLRGQRLDPLAKVLGARDDGLPAARNLIVLPSRAMAGIPIEALLTADDPRTVSYAPSATVLRYLRKQPRPDQHSGLLALGDPVYAQADKSSEPQSVPDHGLLVTAVVPGSNAATHGVESGDVLLTYNGQPLNKKDDLKVVVDGDKPIGVDVWRAGRSSRRELARGKPGVVFDPRPAPVAISENRKLQQVLVAARSGGEDFAPLPATRYEVEALARLFKSDDRPTRILLGADASESEMDQLAASGGLSRFGFIHLATHGVIDEAVPMRSAVILTQTGLPDPLEQVLNHKPVFDGRLLVREIQHGWDLKAELVTLSACETALGREAGGEGFVGFTQALLMSGARSVCLSLWKVDDTATALLMQRFYANLLGKREGLTLPMPKAEALREAKVWLRQLGRGEVLSLITELSGGVDRSKGIKARQPAAAIPVGDDSEHPYAPLHYWAAFVLSGGPV